MYLNLIFILSAYGSLKMLALKYHLRLFSFNYKCNKTGALLKNSEQDAYEKLQVKNRAKISMNRKTSFAHFLHQSFNGALIKKPSR